ncbi:MAG: hypothetical protein GC136_02205 [Alphaproteobacteria bacterium]|nr:hypothetical protein [Alphaproteobacteria bacterium]
MGLLKDIYSDRVLTPLGVDAYHITTLYAYWREGRASADYATYAFGRKEPQNGGFGIVAGVETIVELLNIWKESGFTQHNIDRLRSIRTSTGKQKYPDEFLHWLQHDLKKDFAKIRIDALPDGSVFFPQEVVARFQGPIGAVKLLESPDLCFHNGKIATVTRAARIMLALEKEHESGSPKGRASVQGLRRGSSLGSAIESSIDAEMGGFTSTSTGAAAELFGQVWAGTMDHAWVQNHDFELSDIPLAEFFRMEEAGEIKKLQKALTRDAFRSYAFAHPDDGILLCDTYDPIQGIDNAITVIKELRALGHGGNYGVRFDSDDLAKYSLIALRKFVEAGFAPGFDATRLATISDEDLLKEAAPLCNVLVAPADGLDEYSIGKMRAQGAYHGPHGVGTSISHVPPVGIVFKSSAIEIFNDDMEPTGELRSTMKICVEAPAKSSNPGVLDMRRYYNEDSTIAFSVIYDVRYGLDEQGRAVSAKDFSKEITIGDMPYKDALVPMIDANGDTVYEWPQRPRFPGSTEMTTDKAAQNKFVRAELATLPAALKEIYPAADDVAKDQLLRWFKHAQKAGESTFEVSVDALTEMLPPPVAKMPVYFDYKLMEHRRACEAQHLHRAGSAGIGDFNERYEP